jgi:hypothetical protein
MSLDNGCMLLWWMRSTDSDCVSLVSSGVLLGVVVYHWIVVVYYYGYTQLFSIGWNYRNNMLLSECHGDYH